jgi:3-(3-hydroxy-phenyl)propionate hydroxylase
MSNNQCDILVVGLGPVGDVLTGLLKTQGLSVIAIDREADIYPLPRAAVFDEEVMRIFQMIGVSEAIAPLCRVPEGYQFLTAKGETLLAFPMRPGMGPYGWEATYALHQPGVERALRTRLTELGADVRVSTTLTSFTQDDQGVVAQVEGPQGPYVIHAKYIVGCDGARSPVRESLRTTTFDYDFEESWLVIDSIIEDGDDLPQIPCQICDPTQPTTFLRMSGPRYRWEFMLKPGDDEATFASDENLERLLAPWNVMHRIQIERRAIYRFRGLLANEWRKGRALIAGDAAHQMPPFAGQGMCSGVRDACNLAWKLAAVVRGEASDALLDTYQLEREPHVRGIIETAVEMGKTVCVLDPNAAAARDAAMIADWNAGKRPPMIPYPPLAEGCLIGGAVSGELFIQPMIDGERMDYRLGEGPWLITKTTVDSDLKQFVIESDALGSFSTPLAAWLDEHAADAVLVRPDRHIFGVGKAADLVEAWRAKLGLAMEVAA